MALENIKRQVEEYMKDMHGLPPKSPYRKIAKDKLKDYLKEVKVKHGQETVDKIMNYKPKVGNVKLPVIMTRCRICNNKVSEKRLERHMRRNHPEKENAAL